LRNEQTNYPYDYEWNKENRKKNDTIDKESINNKGPITNKIVNNLFFFIKNRRNIDKCEIIITPQKNSSTAVNDPFFIKYGMV